MQPTITNCAVGELKDAAKSRATVAAKDAQALAWGRVSAGAIQIERAGKQ